MFASLVKKIKEKLDKKCNKNDCTCFIDKLFSKRWGKCCKAHDIAYIHNFEKKSKEQIDLEFLECLEKHTYKWLARLMYYAVSESFIAKNYWNSYREDK